MTEEIVYEWTLDEKEEFFGYCDVMWEVMEKLGYTERAIEDKIGQYIGQKASQTVEPSTVLRRMYNATNGLKPPSKKDV